MALENTNDTRMICCKNGAKIRLNKDNVNIGLITPQNRINGSPTQSRI